MTTSGARNTGDTPGPTVAMREYFERILAEQEKAQAATFAAATREADANNRELERRLEGLNDLRSEVTRDRARYIDRTEYGVRHESLEKRLATIERNYSKLCGIGLALIVATGIVSTLLGAWIK